MGARFLPKIASKLAPSARVSISKIAPKVRGVRDVAKKVFSKKSFQGALGLTTARGVAESVASGDISALRPSAVEAGLIAGSPFGFIASAGGALLGGYRGEIRNIVNYGKEAGGKVKDIYGQVQLAQEGGYTSSDPLVGRIQDILNTRSPDITYPNIEYPTLDYPDITYPNIEYPDIDFAPTVQVTAPDINVPVSADVGFGGINPYVLATMLGIPVAYLLGKKKRKKKRKKYKRKGRKK